MKKIFLVPALAVSVNFFGQLPGHYCGTTPNPLTGNFEIDLDKFDYYFTGRKPGINHVNIGYPCNAVTDAKLNIHVDTTTSPNSPDSYGIYIENFSGVPVYSNFGVKSEVLNLKGTATGQFGLWGNTYGGQKSVGVHGSAASGGLNAQAGAFGGEFTAIAATNGNNYGIYATAANAFVNNWAGYFDGDVVINAGSGTYALTVNGSSWQSAGTAWATSDKKFKKDIVKLEGVTGKLQKISGYTYSFKTDEFPDRHFDKTPTIGLLAQELKEVFPQLVMTDSNGDLAVNYQGMIPVLLESIKEQQKQLDEQNKAIEELKNLLQARQLTAGIEQPTALNGVNMSQNEPNPFTHETVIKYTLPASVSSAYMAVYDLSGKQITSFSIEQKGSSSLTVTSEKLAPGIYIYSIVADGKVVDSKRMIVAEK